MNERIQTRIKGLLLGSPRWYDAAIRAARLMGSTNPIYDVLIKDPFCGRSLTFIQIGANDGLFNDPIREFAIRNHWQGLVVEPVPDSYKKLQRNYSRFPGIRPIRCAVAYYGSSKIVLYQARSRGEDWRDIRISQVASGDPEHLLRHSFNLKPEDLERIEVPACTLESLVRENDITCCDFLTLDVEGGEAQVLLKADLDALRIRRILFEHVHMDEGERGQVMDRLKTLGFTWTFAGTDTYCRRELPNCS